MRVAGGWTGAAGVAVAATGAGVTVGAATAGTVDDATRERGAAATGGVAAADLAGRRLGAGVGAGWASKSLGSSRAPRLAGGFGRGMVGCHRAEKSPHIARTAGAE